MDLSRGPHEDILVMEFRHADLLHKSVVNETSVTIDRLVSCDSYICTYGTIAIHSHALFVDMLFQSMLIYACQFVACNFVASNFVACSFVTFLKNWKNASFKQNWCLVSRQEQLCTAHT